MSFLCVRFFRYFFGEKVKTDLPVADASPPKPLRIRTPLGASCDSCHDFTVLTHDASPFTCNTCVTGSTPAVILVPKPKPKEDVPLAF